MFQLINALTIIYLLFVSIVFFKKNNTMSKQIYYLLIRDEKEMISLKQKYNDVHNKVEFLKYLRNEYTLNIKEANMLIDCLKNIK